MLNSQKDDELFVYEQIEQIKKYTKPDKELIESVKWRVHNPDRIYALVFRFFCISVLMVLCLAAVYFFGYALPASQKLMNDVKEYEGQLGECNQDMEDCIQEDGFLSKEDQKRFEKRFIEIYGKYLKKNSQFYQCECKWTRENLASNQIENMDTEEADAEEMNPEETDSEKTVLEELRKKGKKVIKYQKGNYLIGWKKAEISIWTQTKILVGDEEYDDPDFDTKTHYTFERTKDGWKIVNIELEQI